MLIFFYAWIFSCLILSLEYKFLTIYLKSYILRKNCAKKLHKTKISFQAQLSQKNISGFAQIAQKK